MLGQLTDQLRGETSERPLFPLHDRPAHYDSLDAVLEAAWDCLSEGARNRRSGFHTMTVATLRKDGWPTLRTVVLRGFNPDTRDVVFHTDLRTRKFEEIASNPRIGVHFYDPQRKIQLRLDCLARIDMHNEKSRASWLRARPMSRECYAQLPPPGSVLGNGAEAGPTLDDDMAFENFAVVTAQIEVLDWLFLAAAGHRRARCDWSGGSVTKTWLAP
jgi:3-hydroxyisobutyrate dehydrogenase